MYAPTTPNFPRREIRPRAYDMTEKLTLDFWDPSRLAAHVMATLCPKDRGSEAVDFIMQRQITGAFIARYTWEIERLLSHKESKIVRDIAETISASFWIPSREPRAPNRYTLRDIVEDLRRSDVVPLAGASSWVEGVFPVGEEEGAAMDERTSPEEVDPRGSFPRLRSLWDRISVLCSVTGFQVFLLYLPGRMTERGHDAKASGWEREHRISE